MTFRRKGKFNNRWTTCFLKHNHQSMREAAYCNRLQAQLQRGEIMAFKTQVKFELYAGINHFVDFLVTSLDGHDSVHETKGVETAVFKMKKKMFQAKYPMYKYIIIF